jgi:hypothetical protein
MFRSSTFPSALSRTSHKTESALYFMFRSSTFPSALARNSTDLKVDLAQFYNQIVKCSLIFISFLTENIIFLRSAQIGKFSFALARTSQTTQSLSIIRKNHTNLLKSLCKFSLIFFHF